MAKKYKTDAMAAVHELMSDLHDSGVADKRTMRKFDKMCLTQIEPLSPQQIKGIRQKSNVSQSVFARYLNITPNTVSQWERGEKKPAGASLKLLGIVQNKGLEALI